MSLKTRVTLILLALFCVCVAAYAAVQKFVVHPEFVSLELEQAHKDLNRCRSAIEREVTHLDVACLDWSHWQETYSFVTTDSSAKRRYYESRYLDAEFLSDMHISLLYFFNADHKVVWGEAREIDTLRVIQIKEFEHDVALLDPRLFEFEGNDESHTGLMETSAGPMLVAARPILSDDEIARRGGTLIVGRLLSREAIDSIAARAGVTLTILTSEQAAVETATLPLNASYSALGVPVLTNDSSPTSLIAYAGYPNLFGDDGVMLKVSHDRGVLQRGEAAMQLALVSMVGAGVAIVCVLWIMMHRVVVGPIERLTHGVEIVAQEEDLTRNVSIHRHDEIGALATKFNLMLQRLHAIQSRLHHDAHHDALTGLPNRSGLLERLATCLDYSRRRNDATFALLFLDVNKFKQVNDALGHDVGDQLLIEIAQRLQVCVRGHDQICRNVEKAVARLGGDEFVILLDGIRTDEDACTVAERVCEAMSQPFNIAGHVIHSGAAVGITTAWFDYHDASDVLRDADTAMYRAKKQGGGRFAMFDPAIDRDASDQASDAA